MPEEDNPVSDFVAQSIAIDKAWASGGLDEWIAEKLKNERIAAGYNDLPGVVGHADEELGEDPTGA